MSVAKTADLPAERVNYAISVVANTDVTLEQVLESVRSLGIGAKELTCIETDVSGYEAALAALRRTLPEGPMDLRQVRSYIAATAATYEATRQRLLPELMTEARRSAELTARTTGGALGKVLSVTESAYGGAVLWGGGLWSSVSSNLRATFYLNVRFALQ